MGVGVSARRETVSSEWGKLKRGGQAYGVKIKEKQVEVGQRIVRCCERPDIGVTRWAHHVKEPGLAGYEYR